jgi:beta-lactamase regulating signal transducer with metallopeptidase domain
MTAIEILVRQPAGQAVGWALLQFVWQGAAVGIVTALALAMLRRSASDVRYIVASVGLALMLTLPLVSGVQKFQALRAEADLAAGVSTVTLAAAEAPRSDAARLSTPGSQDRSAGLPSGAAILGPLSNVRVEPVLPALILVWIAGVSMLSLRLLTGWLWVQRLRTRGVAPAEDQWQRMAARLSRRLHIQRAITLLESTLVDVPTVIGWMKPVVLLPASALAALSPQQLEAILAHELAHIRRHDYLVNLLQTLVETLLFYHPAVWWLSRRIRIERENCCDDLAVSLCGDPVAYANALADLESLRSGPEPDHHIAMAATGGSLLQRVRRLLGAPSSHTGRAPAWLAGSVALLLIGGIALGADGVRQPGNAPVTAAGSLVPETAQVPASIPSSPEPVSTPSSLDQDPAVPAVPAVPAEPPVAPEPPAVPDSAALPVPADLETQPVPEVPPAPAVAPAPAVGPTPPAPPAPASGSQSISHQVNDSRGNWTWSNDGEKLEISYSGAFEFTDDDTDIRQLSLGGYLKISNGAWVGRHSVEIRERGGQLERRYFVNLSERPYEPEGRAWLAANLPKFVRNTGIGAPARVARYLKSGGVPGVMGEIARIGSGYVKGIYFKELFKQASLTPEQYRQAMALASREIKSDYELASLLISIADRLPNDETSRDAYFLAASSISSDYELRRVYSTMLKKGPVSGQTLAGILTHSTTIESDYELSELLRQVMAAQTLDDRNRAAFFRAIGSIQSDYERHRILKSVVDRSPDAATIEAALAAAVTMTSSYEAATFLHSVVKQSGVEGGLRAPFFRAVARVSSGHERGRLLQAVVKKPGVSTDTLREVLRSTTNMSGYELSQLLQAVATTHAITGDLREAYLDTADRLSGYEQGQVLTALIKSERRR